MELLSAAVAVWGLSWVYAAHRLRVSPARLVLVPFQTALRLVWSYTLVLLGLALALFSESGWVVWACAIAMTLTGLILTTRATQVYARSLIERGAERLLKGRRWDDEARH